MGADELAAALHAPLRSELSSLWGDDDAAAEAAVAVSPSSSSSSGASSPALPPQQQQQPLVAAPSFFFPIGDLSAFLPTHQQQQQPTASSTMATTPNFLDDLLSSTDDLDFRVRGGTNSSTATATSSSSSSVFAQTPLTHSLPPSIQQQLVQSLQAQRQLAAGLGSLTDLELDGAVDPAQLPASLRGATASRLLQLENNYERKKKRAKINRKDLNARFQELMDILNLKEDRKLNRAKVLEKAIEYIERLEDELQAVRSQAEAKKAAASAPHQVLLQQQQQQQQQSQQPTAAQMLLPTSSATHAIGGSGSLVAFNPSNAHAWAAAAAAGASSIPMAPMMWLPCSVVAPPPPSSAALRAASRVRTEKRSACRGTKSSSAAADAPVAVASARSVSLALPEVSEVSTSGPRRSLKRTREGSAVASASAATAAKDEDSVFVWGAREIPTLLAFCDAWTLVSLLQTSREVAAVARRDALWLELARHRWRLGEALTPNAREQWMVWHREMRMPACGAISPSSTRFAAGRAHAVDVWGLLARRSNGRTTRTVLIGGKAAVTQVVELYVVVQNMGLDAIRLSDDISVGLAPGASGGVASLTPFTAASGAHLTPHVISLNDGACVTRALESVVLRHGDVCVLDVFIECPGLDLEHEFLQRAEWLDVRCVAAKDETRVAVRARCVEEAGKKQQVEGVA